MTETIRSLDDALDERGRNDLIPHRKLMAIAQRAWQMMPLAERASKQAIERWRAAIYLACKQSLDLAAATLKERNDDEPSILNTKLMLLKETFVNQVNRAMRDLSEGTREQRNKVKALDAVNAMIKKINHPDK